MAEQLTVYQQNLKKKNVQMKAMASELNMYQAQASILCPTCMYVCMYVRMDVSAMYDFHLSRFFFCHLKLSLLQ